MTADLDLGVEIVAAPTVPLKFVKHYADMATGTVEATRQFIDEIKTGTWPDDAHSYH
jgi:ketopantoate hydroxymethyltransferase